MKKETEKKVQEVISKIDKKQLIVGIIILFVAILTLSYAFMGSNENEGKNIVAKETTVKVAGTQNEISAPEATTETTAEVEAVEIKEIPHVALTFTATVEKDVEYVISYTTEEEKDFNRKNVVTKLIKAGTADYKIDFPVEKIGKFRFDMGVDSGKMNVKNFKLIGTQEEDISNPTYYEMMGRISLDIDRSFIVEEKGMATLIYHPEFKTPEVKEEVAVEEINTEATETTEATEEVKAEDAAETTEPKAETAEVAPKTETAAEEKAAE